MNDKQTILRGFDIAFQVQLQATPNWKAALTSLLRDTQDGAMLRACMWAVGHYKVLEAIPDMMSRTVSPREMTAPPTNVDQKVWATQVAYDLLVEIAQRSGDGEALDKALALQAALLQEFPRIE